MTTPKPFTTSDDNMRSRMALALQSHHHPDIAASYEQTISIEGASPKPCIVPGNALQLIDDDDDPAASRTPPSIIIITNEQNISHDPPSTPETSSLEPDNEADHEPEPSPQPPRRAIPKVRFRSRVRITSGLRRHRHSTPGAAVGGDAASPSPSTSVSGSPSSSISAPLRYQADENTTWGPLGRRLSAYAHSNGWQKRSPKSPGRTLGVGAEGVGVGVGAVGGGGIKYDRPVVDLRSPDSMMRSPSKKLRQDERTALLHPGRTRRPTYMDGHGRMDSDTDDERSRLIGAGMGTYYASEDEESDAQEERALRAAALRREEDAVFGHWPWRLFNRHWWRWRMEPVLCCCCSDDSDYDE